MGRILQMVDGKECQQLLPTLQTHKNQQDELRLLESRTVMFSNLFDFQNPNMIKYLPVFHSITQPLVQKNESFTVINIQPLLQRVQFCIISVWGSSKTDQGRNQVFCTPSKISSLDNPLPHYLDFFYNHVLRTKHRIYTDDQLFIGELSCKIN